MRKDDNGVDVPATLGEYETLVADLAPESEARAYLVKKIGELGAEHVVEARHAEMLQLLTAPEMLADAKWSPVVVPAEAES